MTSVNKDSVNKKTSKSNTLAIAVLALSMTQAVNASGGTTEIEPDNSVTYWGLGIGSVIGAVIAGPPGAALGATLGGSIGWGQDKNSALEQNIQALNQREHALEKSQAALQSNLSSLNNARQKVSELSRSNDQQAARLSALMMQDDSGNSAISSTNSVQNKSALKDLIAHYAQDVYFRNGVSEVPDYAESRLNRLSELLQSQPNLQVMLKGYTDHRGAAAFNTALAQSRVEGIRDALLAEGIEAQRVTVQAVGEAESLVENDTANYVLDRRVSIELSIRELNEQPIASIGEAFQ